ncbi:hypothetical protein HELRODRAFT_75940, partial [Helobdella robusta]|uniref:Pyroglutamyl-peptidase I n=1 Tax=Helobdella robusta TaxID=6412 RepID=T1G2D0_HELRO
LIFKGFGPFAMHVVNASWEAVKELSKMGLGKEAGNVKLITEEIPVIYDAVRQYTVNMWNTHKPQLVVHVGVSGIAQEITLEKQAHNHGYDKLDICGCTPDGECCVEGAEECIETCIDMQAVCDYINQSDKKVTAVVSTDPGRYLCDFIYFSSLTINKSRTTFIHVPPLDRPYSARQLAEGLRLAIVAMLQQLKLVN